jgi:hypothetical protein
VVTLLCLGIKVLRHRRLRVFGPDFENRAGNPQELSNFHLEGPETHGEKWAYV